MFENVRLLVNRDSILRDVLKRLILHLSHSYGQRLKNECNEGSTPLDGAILNT